jgi:hypothetical protein
MNSAISPELLWLFFDHAIDSLKSVDYVRERSIMKNYRNILMFDVIVLERQNTTSFTLLEPQSNPNCIGDRL